MTEPLFNHDLTPAAPPSALDLDELSQLPSSRALYLKALIGRRAGLKRGEAFPRVGLSAPWRLERSWLRDYLEICRWGAESQVTPLTVGQVCAAPVQSALLMGDYSPVSPLGLVHASNELLALQPLPLEEELWISVWFGESAWRPRGVTVDLHTVIARSAQRDEPLWMGRTTVFKALHPDQEALKAQRAQRATPPPPLREEPRAAQPLSLELPPDMGRRYAPIARDHNPIHLYPWSARLFGFKRPIVHGMWALARSLAEAVPSAGAASTGELTVRFKRPLELPSQPQLTLCAAGDGSALSDARFELRSARDQLAVEGAWRLT